MYLYLSIALLIMFSACTSEESAFTVAVCSDPTDLALCSEDQTEFTVGQSLSVRLEAKEPFKERQIIGKILRLTETDTISLGARVITPQPNQRLITQNLPFHEFGAQSAGTFLIEFLDESNQVLTQKRITIK